MTGPFTVLQRLHQSRDIVFRQANRRTGYGSVTVT